MNNTFKNVLIFAAGAFIGSAVTWKLVKTKYEKIAQEEIDSVKEVYSRKKASGMTAKAGVEETEQRLYEEVLHDSGYSNPSEEKVEGSENVKKPYVISPDEFGEIDEYDRISLTYYADQILTDEDDELVEDVEETVGFDSLNHFGEYEDDSVFVRNERLKTDFEILLDQRKFSEIRKRYPRRLED